MKIFWRANILLNAILLISNSVLLVINLNSGATSRAVFSASLVLLNIFNISVSIWCLRLKT